MPKRLQQSFRIVVRKATDPVYGFKRWARLRAAAAWRRRFTGTSFIGITGSHGKTTATGLLTKILATKGPTGVGIGHNLDKSVARNILRSRPRDYRYYVQEVAASEPKVIERSIGVLRPSVGIVTAISGDHRSAFGGSMEAIAAEKAKLVHCLSAEGLAVLNADDPLVAAMAEGCRSRVVTFGRAEGSTLRILEISSAWPDRVTFSVGYRGERFTVRTQLVGGHWTLSVSAALLAALELGVDRSDCLAAIEAQEPIYNRMSVHPGPNGAWYVLDAEKASYFGIEACLGFLETASAPRKTVVIGSISDYPGAGRQYYYKVARMALARAERVIFAGANAARVRRLADREFPDRLLWIEEPAQVLEMLSEDALADEVIYIKASPATGLHHIFAPLEPRVGPVAARHSDR